MPTDPTIPAAAPDWSTIPDQILCPLCDYNLRGLATPRCPECGYQFAWPEVLDPTLRRHDYLFEHQHNKNLWSFWQTVTGTLHPRTFWQSLHPVQPSRLGRLLSYWSIIAYIFCLPLLLFAIRRISIRTSLDHIGPLRTKILIGGSSSVWGQTAASLFETPLRTLVIFLVFSCLIWPFVTFALLLTFQSSMRMARIKPSHVLRCVIYSADMPFWIGPPLAVCLVGLGTLPWNLLERAWWTCLLLGLAIYLVMVYRLVTAYRFYLRFHRATATVLATQLIVGLIVLIILGGIAAGWFR